MQTSKIYINMSSFADIFIDETDEISRSSVRVLRLCGKEIKNEVTTTARGIKGRSRLAEYLEDDRLSYQGIVPTRLRLSIVLGSN